jgi:outer membrane receptor protein involved in Fe transport
VNQPKVEIQRSKDETSLVPSLNDNQRYGRHRGGLISILAAIFLLLSGAVAASAAQRSEIRGTVADPGDNAVPSARVSLIRSHAVLNERQTDANGTFEFSGLQPGAYKLVANLPGFSMPSVAVDLREDQTRVVDLKLELSAVHQQVVVSATLGAALAPEIGSSLTVLTRQELNDRGAQAALEALRGAAGVEVNQAGRRGASTGLFIRGGESNFNLIMIDGIQVNEFGGEFTLAPLPVDGVDRVEVIRGPQSALYGSNAVSGVVNLVSRKGTGRPRFTAQAEGGSFTTRRFSTGGSGLTRGLSWSYNLARLDSGGVVANDRYRNQSAFLSLGTTRWARRQLDFHFFGDANQVGAPGPYGSDPLGLFPGLDLISRNKQNLFAYRVHYGEQLSSRLRQVVIADVATNDFTFRTPFGDSFSNNLRGVVSTRSEITVSSKDFLVLGFEYNRERIENTFIADVDDVPFRLPRTSLAFVAENRWSPVKRLYVTSGMRVDNIGTHELPPGGFGLRPLLPESSVNKVSPRVSVAFLARESTGGGWLGATRLHGSFGTGIRAPSGFELAFSDNPRLEPEESLSFDAGIEQRFFADRAVLDATYFFNRFEDMIVVVGGSLANLSSFLSDNLANSRAQGVEFSFRIRPRPSIELAGHYTRLNSSILALDGSSLVQLPFEIGQPLLRRPRNSGGFNATWHRGRLMLNLNGYVRGEVLDVEPNFGTFGGLFPNKGYVLANTGFSYRLRQGVEVYGRLNNFLNQKYEESLGFPALGLNFLAGIRISFPPE